MSLLKLRKRHLTPLRQNCSSEGPCLFSPPLSHLQLLYTLQPLQRIINLNNKWISQVQKPKRHDHRTMPLLPFSEFPQIPPYPPNTPKSTSSTSMRISSNYEGGISRPCAKITITPQYVPVLPLLQIYLSIPLHLSPIS